MLSLSLTLSLSLSLSYTRTTTRPYTHTLSLPLTHTYINAGMHVALLVFFALLGKTLSMVADVWLPTFITVVNKHRLPWWGESPAVLDFIAPRRC